MSRGIPWVVLGCLLAAPASGEQAPTGMQRSRAVMEQANAASLQLGECVGRAESGAKSPREVVTRLKACLPFFKTIRDSDLALVALTNKPDKSDPEWFRQYSECMKPIRTDHAASAQRTMQFIEAQDYAGALKEIRDGNRQLERGAACRK